MSQFPNMNPSQGFFNVPGSGSGSGTPVRPNASGVGSPGTNYNFNPAQLQQLTDFHRGQGVSNLSHQRQAGVEQPFVAQGPPSTATRQPLPDPQVVPEFIQVQRAQRAAHAQSPSPSQIPPQVQAAITSGRLTPQQTAAALAQLAKRQLQLPNNVQIAQAILQLKRQQQQQTRPSIPVPASRPATATPTPQVQAQTQVRPANQPPAGPRQATNQQASQASQTSSSSNVPTRLAPPVRPSVPITQAFARTASISTTPPVSTLTSSPSTLSNDDPPRKTVQMVPPTATVHFNPIEYSRRDESTAPNLSREPYGSRFYDMSMERRRATEGMRGSMRNELARLMYATGDVPEPDVDAVDYMEDLVVDFLADLCRPVPPVRPNVNAAHQPVPLTTSIVRHRLSSRPCMRKYLDRFDTMSYLSGELSRSRRIFTSTESHHDLVETVGREYLGIDETNTIPRKRGRPPKDRSGLSGVKPLVKSEPGGGGESGDGDERKERKKPGPKKGWKAARIAQGLEVPKGNTGKKYDADGNRIKRPYKRRKQEDTGPSASTSASASMSASPGRM